MSQDQTANRRSGADLIVAERQRQIEVEGWTPEHDREHHVGELGRAARCYITAAWQMEYAHRYYGEEQPGALAERVEQVMREVPVDWPWDEDWWKPTPDPIRNLVKAGALVAAELDRLLPSPSERTGTS